MGRADIVQFPVERGGTAFVEVDRDELGVAVRASASGTAVASASFEGALRQIGPAANAIIREVRDLDGAPEEVEIRFGIRLSAEMGAVISKNRSESHFEVRVVWRRSDDELVD
jgi:hypothetical protein